MSVLIDQPAPKTTAMRARAGETLDGILHRAGRSSADLAAALNLNPALTDCFIVPETTLVFLPAVASPRPATRPILQLWS